MEINHTNFTTVFQAVKNHLPKQSQEITDQISMVLQFSHEEIFGTPTAGGIIHDEVMLTEFNEAINQVVDKIGRAKVLALFCPTPMKPIKDDIEVPDWKPDDIEVPDWKPDDIEVPDWKEPPLFFEEEPELLDMRKGTSVTDDRSPKPQAPQ